MTINGTLAETLASALSVDTQFSDVSFVIAYENTIKPTPVSKPIIALSVKGCDIGERIEEILDSGEIVDTKKRHVDTTVSVDIYLPYSMSGNDGHKLFDRIATYLLYTKSYSISKAACNEADYDSNCEAIIIRSHFVFTNIISA